MLPVLMMLVGLNAPAHASADLSQYTQQQLTWTACRDNLKCSWLTVPLDYQDLSAGDIRIALSMLVGSSTASRYLLVNPGGPGASGLELPLQVQSLLNAANTAQYNIIGFDPRGVGKSAPVTCLSGVQTTRWLRTDSTPHGAAQQARYMRLAAAIGTGCLSDSARVVRHVGSSDTAQDMEVLRAVLHQPTLDYLGFSDGTYLGTLYAQQFPDRVGRFVLDGAVNPALDTMELSADQSVGFQTAISRFAGWCAKRSGCVRATRAGVLAVMNAILARLQSAPMHTTLGETLTQAQAITAYYEPMYSPFSWPDLQSAINQASHGDGTGLLAISNSATSRTGRYQYSDNSNSAFYAIGCWDAPAPPGAAGLARAASQWSAHAAVPEMAQSMSWGNAPCTTWFGHTALLPGPAHSTTSSPILIVGTIYDPATPYKWAVALSHQLPTSRLLTFVGDGHTAFGNGSACIDRSINRYLQDGRLPAPGLRCHQGK